MGASLFFESITAAASVGMGCGTCCGSGISAALYGYLTTHTKDIKHSVTAFLEFFFGKFLAVILLCCAASLVGSNIIDDDVWIAPHTSIRGWVHIGKGATAGMGAVVVKDIPEGETWVGNPAHKLEKKK